MSSSPSRRVSFSFSGTAALQAIACGTLLAHGAFAAEQDKGQDPPPGLSGSIGIGALVTSTYEGSPNRRTLVGPDISLSYRSKDWGTFEMGQRGLIWQALEVGDLRFGLAAGFDPGRKTKKSGMADPTPGDKRLVGMGDVRSSAEVGVLMGYGSLSLMVRKAASDRGHDGALVDLSVGCPIAVTDNLGLRIGANLNWADKHYMQTYFGVTPEQARASGFTAYTAKAGLHKFGISVGAEYEFVKDWKLQSAVTLARLLGSAKDSPLVERKSSPSATVGITHAF